MSYYNPNEIASQFADACVSKSKLPFLKFSLLAVMGGIFIAFGGLLTVVVAGGMPEIATDNIGLVKFTAGALFPIGLIMVSIAGADLFTSDCAGMALSTIQRKTSVNDLLRIWGLAYVFNFIGTQLVVYFMAYKTGIISAVSSDYLVILANHKLSYTWDVVLLKGIGANMLVCLGTWMGYAGKDVIGKALGIWIPVMLFVTLGYEHSIANMFFIPMAMYMGADITWGQFIWDNLILATIGNIIGGAVFIGLFYGYVYSKKTC